MGIRFHINCKEASELVEKRIGQDISTWELVKLKFHLIWCKLCRLYSQHSIKLNNMLNSNFKEIPNHSIRPNIELRKKILTKLSGEVE